MTKPKGSAEGDDKTDVTAIFNNHSELFDTETDKLYSDIRNRLLSNKLLPILISQQQTVRIEAK